MTGCDLATDPVGVRRNVGYVAQGGMTLPEARAGEEIVDHARLYGVSRNAARQRTHALLDHLDLPDVWDRECRSLSGGQRRRLDIAMGLVHEPALVFLDEPTTGQDPQSRANLWDHIRGLRSDLGTTVFLTTHYLDEADALCDRILIIDHGEIVARGTPDGLKREVSGDAVALALADPREGATAAGIVGRETGGDAVLDGATVRCTVPDGAATLPRLLRALDVANVSVAAVEARRPSLDDVFLHLTGRALRDDAVDREGAVHAHRA
ncbi:ATP-binding cassette domain-containing protein [soil metagenome]